MVRFYSNLTHEAFDQYAAICLHIDRMLLLKREANTPAYLDVQALGRFAGDLIRGHSGRQRSPRVLATRRGPSCETDGG